MQHRREADLIHNNIASIDRFRPGRAWTFLLPSDHMPSQGEIMMFHGWALAYADGIEAGRVAVKITDGHGYVYGFADLDLAFAAEELYLVDEELGHRIPVTLVAIDSEGRLQVTSP